MNDDFKYICVGNSKTATSSLQHAFHILGYACIGYSHKYFHNAIINDKSILDHLNNFSFVKDWPWKHFYKDIDKKYKCKFILTLRNEDDWAKSFSNHIRKEVPCELKNKLRKIVYGFDPKDYLDNHRFLIEKIYHKNNQDVFDYFKNRPDDLLVTNIFNGDAWEDLCKFTNKEIPDAQFPHDNKSR